MLLPDPGGDVCSTAPDSATADGAMEITCADCGCLVDRGVVIVACAAYPNCCCTELPRREIDADETT